MKKLTIAIAALAIAGVAQMASAQLTPLSTPSLELVNGTSTAYGTYDGSGVWSFNSSLDGAVGGYTVVVTTGIQVQGGSTPILDLNVDVTSATAGAGALYVIFTDGTYGPTATGYSLISQAYVSTGGMVSTYGYLNTTLLGGSADSTTAPVLNASGSINASSYDLSIEDVVNGGIVSEDSTLSAVPEPSTVMAGALMILPLGFGAFRALRKERTA